MLALNQKTLIPITSGIEKRSLMYGNGLTSKVVTGLIPGNRHAWIEVINPKTKKVMAIIDSNYTESVHPNYEDYISQIMRRYTSRRNYDRGTFMEYKRAVEEDDFVDNEHVLVKPQGTGRIDVNKNRLIVFPFFLSFYFQVHGEILKKKASKCYSDFLRHDTL